MTGQNSRPPDPILLQSKAQSLRQGKGQDPGQSLGQGLGQCLGPGLDQGLDRDLGRGLGQSLELGQGHGLGQDLDLRQGLQSSMQKSPECTMQVALLIHLPDPVEIPPHEVPLHAD